MTDQTPSHECSSRKSAHRPHGRARPLRRRVRPPPVARGRRPGSASSSLLIGLNAAFHGKLINDFKIPGSDTQKATDLITAKFGGRKGAALRVVVAARRTASDSPTAAAIGKMLVVVAGARRRSSPRTRTTSPTSRARSRRTRASSPTTGRSAFFDVQFDRTGFELPRAGHRLARGSAARDRRSRPGIQVEFTGEAESAAADAGHQRHHRPARGVLHPDGALPRARADGDPAAVRDRRGDRRVPDPVPRRALDALQHHHRDPRADDRPRGRHRLHAVHRHALPTVPARRAVAAGRGRGGRRDCRPRGDLRRRDRRDLDHRPRADRARLHHEARDRQRARRAHGGVARELAAAGRSLAAGATRSTAAASGCKPVDESREGQARTPIAAWGRFVSRNAKIVLPVVIVVLLLLASPVLGVAARPRRRRHRAEGPDDAQGLRPALERASARASRSRSRSSIDLQSDHARGRQARDRAQAGAGDQAGRQADLQREEPRRRHRSRSSTPTAGTRRRIEDRRPRLGCSATP